jgi:hypothetical protein
MLFVINNLSAPSCIYTLRQEWGLHHTKQRTQHRRFDRQLRGMDAQLYEDRSV